jgi:hypothetical protein
MTVAYQGGQHGRNDQGRRKFHGVRRVTFAARNALRLSSREMREPCELSEVTGVFLAVLRRGPASAPAIK